MFLQTKERLVYYCAVLDEGEMLGKNGNSQCEFFFSSDMG